MTEQQPPLAPRCGVRDGCLLFDGLPIRSLSVTDRRLQARVFPTCKHTEPAGQTGETPVKIHAHLQRISSRRGNGGFAFHRLFYRKKI